ncbi:MAG: hypothetical protein M1840_008916 [Geoglossum simile]|nr:MAG: hypothetical protein M1840_008916 [Geoglossum simile]
MEGPNVQIPISDKQDDPDADYADDSGIESSSDSDTTSLASFITKYRWENGRRYHAYRDGEYWYLEPATHPSLIVVILRQNLFFRGPNDEQAADLNDISHHLYTLILDGKLCLAPIGDNLQKVLDVGTGTGIWAIDFADQYPSAEVIGTDLSPMQPPFVPPNLRFEIDDCCSEWAYTKSSFDFIHVRGMYGSIADWPKFYGEVIAHLKPGGYYEQFEISVVPRSDDDTIKDGDPLDLWGKNAIEAGDKFGKTLQIVDLQKQYLIDANFEDVVEHRFKVPIGPWSSNTRLRQIGQWNQLMWEEGLEPWAMALYTRVLGVRPPEHVSYGSSLNGRMRG